MTAAEIDQFYDLIKSFHDSEDFKSVIPDLDSSSLIPELREYQIDAVKWMLYKEYQLDLENLPQQFNGMDIHFPKGGILADEMGLGKTVEVIALILNNPCNDPHCCSNGESDVFLDFEESEDSNDVSQQSTSVKEKQNCDEIDETHQENKEVEKIKGKSLRKRPNISYAGLDSELENEPVRKRRKKKEEGDEVEPKKCAKGKSTLYQHLKKWYDLALQEVKHTPRRNHRDDSNEMLVCTCTGYINSEEIQCIRCRTIQHKSCVGLEEYSVRRYYCPKCLHKMKPFKSRATFIVSPDSIVHQWIDEIKRHVKRDKLKVHYYTGVRGSYIQPAELADNDIVITTYSVLSSDLNYCVEESSRKLRYEKKFHSFPPPIKAIDWWRICLDEAQMVEGPNTKPGIMTRELAATHRWAVTGTPIQKSYNDLYGLMQFFMMEPFSEMSVWNQLLEERGLLCVMISHILWRSRKKHVYSMLGIPEQTVLTHWLTFSPVEGHFYDRTHLDCASQFKNKLSRFDDMKVTLTSLDRGFVSKLMIPLLSLRQACTHPQAVRGMFLKYKRTMTMEELLSDMVSHAKQDVDVCVRTMVSANNGRAGLKLLLGEINEAVSLYREVLQLPSQYPKDIIKVDKLQLLHTLHNLAEVIREFKCAPPTLRDETLGQEAEDLARNYIQNYERLIDNSYKNLVNLKSQVDAMRMGRPLGYNNWWEEVITDCDDPMELVSRVRINVLDQQTKFPIKCSYSNKIRNIDTLYGELALWLAQTDEARSEMIKILENLHKTDAITMSEQAVECHIGSIYPREKNKRMKCKLCTAETNLLAYESRIFSITKEDQEGRKKNKYALSDDEVEPKEENKKEIEDLKGTQVLMTNKEGNWKPSQMERIIQVLLTYAKSKKFNQSIIQSGQKHLSLLEGVRKEFLSFRTLWRHLSDRAAAYDELTMAKLRFRLPQYGEVKLINKKKLKAPFIIQLHEIQDQFERLENEKILAERDISKNIGILMYLKNLQKNPSTERDPCPVCQEPLSKKWSVLQCGHCFCFECIPNMFGNITAMQVDCAVCRQKTHRLSIAYVDCSLREPRDDKLNIKGSYSTKVEAVLVHALNINKEDPTAKILVFSSWEKVLDVIGEAFESNELSFRRLTANKSRSKKSLADFKNSDVTALLMPLRLGSKGLNLIEATHVFFVEPILNPGDELQAVGRVHRIGQTKKTYVHRFVIRSTIEDKMLSALDTSSTDDWSAENVTVEQLFNLFKKENEGQDVEEDAIVIDN